MKFMRYGLLVTTSITFGALWWESKTEVLDEHVLNEKEVFRTNSTEALAVVLDDLPMPSDWIKRLPLIPRKKDCEVQFVDPKRSLCYSSNSIWDRISLAVVRRLLEQYSECSADNVAVLDISNTRFRHADCLHVRPRPGKGHQHDIEWNASSIFLLPFLYQDYYAMPTMKKHHPLTYCVIGDDIVQRLDDPTKDGLSILNISSDSSWQSLYEQARFCDFIASNQEEGLILADSMRIPAATLQLNRSWYSEEEHVVLQHIRDVINFRLYIPSDRRPRFEEIGDRLDYLQAQRIVETFPFDLFESKVSPRADDASAPVYEQPKTLVVVIGNLRGGEPAWQSLYQNVLDVNGADLALLIGNSTDRTSSMYSRATYLWEHPEYTDWGEGLDTINGSSWRTNLVVAPRGGILGGVEGHPGSGAIIFMERYWLIQKIKELGLQSKYQRFILTRSDFLYKCRHDLKELDPRYVWVPHGEDYGGITDRHVVASSELIIKVLNILAPLVTRPERHYLVAKSGSPEIAIRLHWTTESIFPHQVRRFPRPMYVGYQRGDMSRWGKKGKKRRKKEGRTEDGVFPKYTSEYYFARCFCEGGTLIDDQSNTSNWKYTDASQSFLCK
jgi:hypothetical protein